MPKFSPILYSILYSILCFTLYKKKAFHVVKMIKKIVTSLLVFQANAFINFKGIRTIPFRSTRFDRNYTSDKGYCRMIFSPDEIINLHVYLGGIGTIEVVDDSTQELIKHFGKYPQKLNVLVDMTDAVSATRKAISNIVSFGRYYYYCFDKIAIVVSNNYFLNYVRIFLFATNQRYCIKAFTNENNAEEWLIKSSL